MRNRFWTLALAVPLAVLPASMAASQDETPHQRSTRMVEQVLANQSGLGLTASQVKKLEQYRNQLELQALQQRQSSKPQNTNTVLVTTPDQAKSRILSILGTQKQDAVLRAIEQP